MPRRRGLRPARLLVGRATLVALALILPVAGPGALAEREEPSTARDGADLGARIAGGPVVVLGTVVRNGSRERVSVEKIYRGERVARLIRIDARQANAVRAVTVPPFRVELDERAIFVLEPAVDLRGARTGPQTYQPAEGYRSKIPLPAEGEPALIDAVSRLVGYQDRPDRGVAEAELADWLTGPNPWLVDFALDQAARFELAGPAWVPGLIELSRAVDPWHRGRAVRALGAALKRGRFEGRRSARRVGVEASEETNDLLRSSREAIVRLARTDPDPAVRIAAVRQLPGAGYAEARAVLEAIGREDADQDVRYEAAAALRRLPKRGGGGGRSAR